MNTDDPAVTSNVSRVLAADDDPITLRILTLALERWGYEVLAAEDGDQAYALLTSDDPPRLALLDWMMPGHNGIELCRMLRDRTDSPFIYAILLTSRTEMEDIIDGLGAGAQDYVVKPFNLKELRNRIEVGVRLVRNEAALDLKNRQLEAHAAHMEHLAEERAHQLVHSERMATLGTLAAGIAHEVNNPASFISGNIQTFQRIWNDLEGPLMSVLDGQEENSELVRRVRFLIEEMPRLTEGIRAGVGRIGRIVKGLKTYAHQGDSGFTECNLHECIDLALDLCHNTLKHALDVHLDLIPIACTVRGNAQQLEQVFVNLFTNAADAVRPNTRGELHIRTVSNDSSVQITVEDNGIGIPPDMLKEIWTPFRTTKEVGKGTGLGLSISQSIIENHKGTIKVSNREGGGVCFIIDLPTVHRREPHERTDSDR